MLPAAFKRYPNITELIIQGTIDSIMGARKPDPGADYCAEMLPVLRRAVRFLPQSLEVIRITAKYNIKMQKEEFMIFLPHLPMTLRNLTISNNSLGPAATVKRLSHLTNLRYLDLSGRWQKVAPESIEGLKEALPSIPRLEALILGDAIKYPKTTKKFDGLPQITLYE